MPAEISQIKSLGIAILIFSTLACRAATRLVIPDTPTPLPTATATITATPTSTPLPTFTATVIFEAACPAVVEGILETVTAKVDLSGEGTDSAVGEDGGIPLITYDVVNNKISDPHIESVPGDLEDERDDRLAHEAIWEYYAALIPAAQRQFVSEFAIFTDGRGKHLAAVSPTFPDPEQWSLQVDILDSESYYDLTYTLIHEQGHLLTLNAEQVPPSDDIFEFPSNETVYQQAADACPQYFSGEGCSEPDSYINQFFTRFWPYVYDEWEQIDLENDKDTRDALLEDFYRTHRDQFLTDYASTSPMEDIAESWAFFVLSPKPELTSIASEKILFFYEYPELVALRTQILNNICAEFPQ
jgi:hypothetical protein